MAKRRSDYRGRRRRKRRSGFLATLFAAVIIIGAVAAAITVFFKVADFEVTGTSLYTAEQIVSASQIQIGDNMFAINEFDVANKIMREYPYVGKVNIRRRLPDTFVFEVTERTRAGFFQVDSLRWLVDCDGYILESIPSDQMVALPQIMGLTLMAPSPGAKIAIEQEQNLYALTQVLAAIEKGDIVRKIGKIDVTKLYSMIITYENRFSVVLGDTQELDKKIRMLKAVVEQIGPNAKGTINVSDVKQARFRPDAKVKL